MIVVVVVQRMMATEIDVPHNRGDSTSPGLSSPPSPNSPTRQTEEPTAQFYNYATSTHHHNTFDAHDGGVNSVKSIGTKATSGQRKARKKKEPDNRTISNNNGNASTATDGQDAKAKKPRAPRGTSEHFKRKQQKILEAQKSRKADQISVSDVLPGSSLPPTNFNLPAQSPPQSRNNEAIPTAHFPSHNNFAQTSRPTSGQNYDPIRSSTVAPRSSSPMAGTPQHQHSHKYPGASASPSINSLIDPPKEQARYSFPQPPKHEIEAKASTSPEPKRPRLSPPLVVDAQRPATSTPRDTTTVITNAFNANSTIPMEVDSDKPSEPPNKTTAHVKKSSPNASTAISSTSHSPKPSRPKEAPVALSSGSGLLSGSIFGGGIDSTGTDRMAPTVVLNVPLNGDNQYVNFTRLAEERYGFNALHPRLAAQRERLARVAAAGAALENASKNGGAPNSGDDMSVDISDAEAENSNVEMSGMNDGIGDTGFVGPKSGEEAVGEAGAVKKPRKRQLKEDMYDKEDDFIDDTELIWEEQAAASKDGFFVYSGPLIPPGEEAKIERYVILPQILPTILH